jgi:hypothetical protein
MMSLWRKFRRLNAEERELVAEAVALLLCVRVGLHVLTFPTLRTYLARRAASSPRSPAQITRAVAAAARRLPGTTCLAEALAAHTMLRRHGHAPQLKVGVRDDGRLAAHAWVECDGEVVAGAVENLAEYVVLS